MFITFLVATNTKLNVEVDASKSPYLDYLKEISLSIVVLRPGVTLLRYPRFVRMRNC